MRKCNLYILGLVVSSFFAQAQTARISNFPLSDVRLLDGPFLKAQNTDMKYILELDADRLLAPYIREAGLKPKKESYGNWENTGLDGHIGGHYISALSNMYASTGNGEVLQRLNYMLDWLEKCQDANGDGYIGGVPGGKAMWKDIAAGKINAGSFSLNNKWVPLYNIHKLYAGLIDAYVLTGNQKAKSILLKYADWAYRLTAKLSDEQIQDMLRSEHGGMNEAFADVAAISGDKKYMTLARRFSHRAVLDPLLKEEDKLTGMHANTQIPKVIGFMRVAELSGDQEWARAADFFWNTVVKNRTVSIGGNSVREHFNPVDNFSEVMESREGPETCNSYNMLKLTKHLFLSDPEAAYMDYYERTVYNHILSSQHPNGGFVYFTPMRPGQYRVYSQPQESFWCCVGSGLENHGKYGEMIYAHADNDLFVNLFMASSLNWKEKGLKLVQQTAFPQWETSTLELTLAKPQTFAMHFRYPSWVENGKMKISINGKEQTFTRNSTSYVRIDRKWKSGDKIQITLPMHTSAEFLPDHSKYVSFVHGPVVLAAATGQNDLQGLRADDSRMGHIAAGPLMSLDDAPLVVGREDELATGIVPENGSMKAYTASNLIYQKEYKNLKLVPFYTLYDTRYVIYWPYTGPDSLQSVINARRLKEEAAAKLEAMTVDLVNTGEQQPESDHGFRGEKTESGLFLERHFRGGKGWFSYMLKNPSATGKNLRVTYHGSDRNRDFDILINGKLLKSVKMEGPTGKQFYDEVYPLPAGLEDEKLEVKFVARDQLSIANIFEIRLIK
jgi:DUF1680 family protein